MVVLISSPVTILVIEGAITNPIPSRLPNW